MPSLTIVAITGHDAYAQGSAFAIERSFYELSGKISDLRCLLVSPTRPAHCPDFIRHVSCQPFGYIEYSLFTLYSLGQLIETDFCLVVQNDGWVIDGRNWRDEFFNYDFIGAPILNLVEFKNNRFHRRLHFSEWTKYCDNLPINMAETQNGGFSLRSRKLLDAFQQLQLNFELSPPDLIHGNSNSPVGFSWERNEALHLEDFVICGYHRLTLMAHGIRFAPTDLAARFAGDRFFVQFYKQIPMSDLLGVHLGRDFVLSGANEILVRNRLCHSVNELVNVPIIQRLLELGYQVIVPDELGMEK